MALILHIETATKTCSVALSRNGKLICLKEEHSEKYIHSERLTIYIKQLFENTGISFKDLDAISLSSGPGSYTGLRIGSSTAKGFCFALNIPLISIPTLEAFENCARLNGIKGVICVMLDARRMEVYSRITNSKQKVLKKTSPDVLEKDSYSDLDPFTIIGNGAEKTKELWKQRELKYDLSINLSALGQIEIAYQKYINGEKEKIAEFEPNYLKEFSITPSKKHILK